MVSWYSFSRELKRDSVSFITFSMDSSCCVRQKKNCLRCLVALSLHNGNIVQRVRDIQMKYINSIKIATQCFFLLRLPFIAKLMRQQNPLNCNRCSMSAFILCLCDRGIFFLSAQKIWIRKQIIVKKIKQIKLKKRRWNNVAATPEDKECFLLQYCSYFS